MGFYFHLLIVAIGGVFILHAQATDGFTITSSQHQQQLSTWTHSCSGSRYERQTNLNADLHDDESSDSSNESSSTIIIDEQQQSTSSSSSSSTNNDYTPIQMLSLMGTSPRRIFLSLTASTTIAPKDAADSCSWAKVTIKVCSRLSLSFWPESEWRVYTSSAHLLHTYESWHWPVLSSSNGQVIGPRQIPVLPSPLSCPKDALIAEQIHVGLSMSDYPPRRNQRSQISQSKLNTPLSLSLWSSFWPESEWRCTHLHTSSIYESLTLVLSSRMNGPRQILNCPPPFQRA